jgi:hypothetical protein
LFFILDSIASETQRKSEQKTPVTKTAVKYLEISLTISAKPVGVGAASQQLIRAGEAILALRPVTFRYKHELDPKGIAQFGLVAEDVEKVNPDLVARDTEGKAYTVCYEAVNAMLLNEFLKEHRKVQEQKETIAQLKHDFAHQQIEALTAGLQRVSAQIEMNRLAPQVVDNRR